MSVTSHVNRSVIIQHMLTLGKTHVIVQLVQLGNPLVRCALMSHFVWEQVSARMV